MPYYPIPVPIPYPICNQSQWYTPGCCECPPGPVGPVGPTGARGTTGPTGGLEGLTANCFGDYIYWDNTKWVVGSQNITLGCQAGAIDQSLNAVAIGASAGHANQGYAAIAIGLEAGFTGQGTSSIAIGNKAGYDASFNAQHDHTIILNATGNPLNSQNANSFYVKPIANKLNESILLYDSSSGEITYNNPNIEPFQGTRAYGSFFDLSSQLMNPIYPRRVQYNNTDLSYGVYIANDGSGNPTRISFQKNGIFNIQFSFQFAHTGGNDPQIFVWLRKNEVDVSSTSTSFFIQKLSTNDYAFAAWNFFVTVNNYLSDYYQLMWISDDTGASLQTIQKGGSTTIGGYEAPTSPSAILTVNQIN